MMEELLDFRLDVDALNVNEISYELRIRNLVVSGTGRQKVIELRKAIERESETPLEIAADEKEFNLAIEALGDLQKELKTAIKEENVEKERLVKSRIRHYQDRAFRAGGENDETDSILYGVVRNIKRTVRMSLEEREEQSPRSSHHNVALGNEKTDRLSMIGRGRGRGVTPSESMTSLRPVDRRRETATGGDNSGSSSFHPQNMPRAAQTDHRAIHDLFKNLQFQDAVEAERRPILNKSSPTATSLNLERPRYIERRRVAVEKWPVRFSGEGSINLTDFLRKVQLYAEADEVTLNEVHKGVFKLLEGIALEWYEVNAGFIHSWDDLVVGLKTRFLLKNYNYIVREETLGRMQLAN